METTERIGLGIPVILLGAIWGAFGLVLEVFTILNERRARVLELKYKADSTFETWDMILWNDWIWLWIGTVAFLATITGVLLFVPQFFSSDDGVTRDLRRKTRSYPKTHDCADSVVC